MTAITTLGIGNIGLAITKTLLSSKPKPALTIWNRTPSRSHVQTAITHGAVFTPSLESAITSSQVIILTLLDYPSIHSIFSTPISSLQNKTIINLTNGTPSQAVEMAALFKGKGAYKYYDGAIMVTPQMIGGPHSFLVVSGLELDQEVKGVLEQIGKVVYLGSEVGAAARFDLAALASMYGMFAGGMAGMGLLKRGVNTENGGKIGVTVKEMIVPFLMALVPYLGEIAEAWDEERWEDDMGNPLGMQLEGVRNIITACEEESVDDGGLKGLMGLMERAVERFGGGGGLAGVGRFVLTE
ncbi:hypothetical protein OQA88_6072 [Cercophora sp. LCS_1]